MSKKKEMFCRRLPTELIKALKKKSDEMDLSDTQVIEEALAKDLKDSGHLDKNLFFGRKPK